MTANLQAKDMRVKNKHWRKRVGFDNIEMPPWSTPEIKERVTGESRTFWRRLAQKR